MNKAEESISWASLQFQRVSLLSSRLGVECGGRQAWYWSVAESSHLICKLQVNRETGLGKGF